ncbi:hypothetical protein NT04LM_4690, partial [Listeria monocytogenes FSL F2-208]
RFYGIISASRKGGGIAFGKRKSNQYPTTYDESS